MKLSENAQDIRHFVILAVQHIMFGNCQKPAAVQNQDKTKIHKDKDKRDELVCLICNKYCSSTYVLSVNTKTDDYFYFCMIHLFIY